MAEPAANQPADQPANQPFEIAVLALQNLTVFPETVVPLGVGRPRSMAAVEAALATPEKLLGCITVRRSEEHTSELQSLAYLVCRLLLEKKKKPRGACSDRSR